MKRRGLFILLSCLLVIVVSFTCMACDGCSSCADNDTSGGESSNIVSYNWSGLKDFNLKITDLDFDYGVTVADVDGLYYDVIVDDSLVSYGKQGEYMVKFTVGEEFKTQTVKVFGEPSMNVSNMAQEFSYEQIADRSSVNGLFSYVDAVDCFGDPIPVGIENSSMLNSLYNVDGSINYGSHIVNIVAVDAAGQLVRKEVSFTVKEDDSTKPSATMDLYVVEDVKSISVDLKSRELMAVSVNGYTLSEELVCFEESTNELKLTLKDIDTLVYGSNNVIRIMTSGGYCDVYIYACEHPSYTQGNCIQCGLPCHHEKYTSGVCNYCAYACKHLAYSNGYCSECSMPCPPHLHDYSNELCSICGEKQILFANGLTSELNGETIIYSINVGKQNISFKNRDKKKWLSFDIMMNSSYGYAYIEPFADMSNPYAIAASNLKIVKRDDGTPVKFTAANWTGENVMKNNVWYTVLVNTNDADFLFKHWWDETGTTKLSNIKFLDIDSRAGDTLSVDRICGETVYTLVKLEGQSCSNYDQANAFWFTTGEAETLTFDFYSDDFNYFQLCSGNGASFMEFDVYNKVSVVNNSTGDPVALNPDADGGIWTGEVLPKSTWLRVTVNVKGFSDLGIVFWAAESGEAYVKNINFNN